MSLDQNLFTLIVTPSKNDPYLVELAEPSGNMHYRKRRFPGSVYKIEVYDPMTEALLITATAPAVSSKTKMLELCNPTQMVELKYTGTISFRWGFKWEEHEFEWKREECFMLRKPDPPILVALAKDTITKEQGRPYKTTSVQILDYNLNRFNIEDRKGLEIVILTALLTFQDANDNGPKESGVVLNNVSTAPQMPVSRQIPEPTIPFPHPGAEVSLAPPPPPPPRPAPASGADRIAELQAMKGQLNEVTVEEEGDVGDYAEYCCRLLEDDITLVSLHSVAAEQVPKVISVVEEIKRRRHKAGLEEEDELYQYVLYDTVKAPHRGPRRINLDDIGLPRDRYAPPNSLTIHLSKFDMPELQPKASAGERGAQEPKTRYDTRATKPPPHLPGAGPSSSSMAIFKRSPSPGSRPPANKLSKVPKSPLWGPAPGQQGALNQPPPPQTSHLRQDSSSKRPKMQSGPRPTTFYEDGPTPSLYGPHTSHLLAPRALHLHTTAQHSSSNSLSQGNRANHLRHSSSFSLNLHTYGNTPPPSPGAPPSDIAAPTPQKSTRPGFLGGLLSRRAS